MTLLEQAKVMASCRLSNKRGKTIRNDKLAVESGLCDEDDAVALCQSLGLHPWATKGHTDLNKMTDYINLINWSNM